MECIKQAFVACPFNEALYDRIIENDLVDVDIFSVVKIFNLNLALTEKLRNKIDIIESKDLGKVIKGKMPYIKSYAICISSNSETVIKNITNPIYNFVKLNYENAINPSSDTNPIYKKLGSLSNEEILNINESDIRKIITACIKSIITQQSFDALVSDCGYSNLIKELSDFCKSDTTIISKSDLDSAYIEQIYKTVNENIQTKKSEILELQKINEEKERIAKEQKDKRTKRVRKGIIISFSTVMVLSLFIVLSVTVIIPQSKYNSAIELMKSEKYEEAKTAFEDLGNWSDSKDKAVACNNAILDIKYNNASVLYNDRRYIEAKNAFSEISEWRDSESQIKNCDYNTAVDLYNKGNYSDAKLVFSEIEDWMDSADYIKNCNYNIAVSLYNEGDYENAMPLFLDIADWKDSKEYINNCNILIYCVIKDHVLTEYKGTYAKVIIPNDVKEIGYGAFRDCDTLTSVIIPDNVTVIGDCAFENCTSLISVIIPDSITTIKAWTFEKCINLTSVTIPDSVTNIENSAFSGCAKLASVTISKNTKISTNAFPVNTKIIYR